MTNVELGVEGVKLCLTLGLLVLLYAGWRLTALDCYVADVRAARDELWDYARKRGLHGADAYKRLMLLADSAVELAPVTNLLFLAAHGVVSWVNGWLTTDPTVSLIGRLPKAEDRAALFALRERIVRRVLRRVFLESATGWAVVALAVIAGACILVVDWAWASARRLRFATIRDRIAAVRKIASARAESGVFWLAREMPARRDRVAAV